MDNKERGMATAEYAVGTLGAVCIGLVLYRLAVVDDNTWFDTFREILMRALSWRPILSDFPMVRL